MLTEFERDARNNRLNETDWMILPDCTTFTNQELIAIKEYRQALRDMTTGVFPTLPPYAKTSKDKLKGR